MEIISQLPITSFYRGWGRGGLVIKVIRCVIGNIEVFLDLNWVLDIALVIFHVKES